MSDIDQGLLNILRAKEGGDPDCDCPQCTELKADHNTPRSAFDDFATRHGVPIVAAGLATDERHATLTFHATFDLADPSEVMLFSQLAEGLEALRQGVAVHRLRQAQQDGRLTITRTAEMPFERSSIKA